MAKFVNSLIGTFSLLFLSGIGCCWASNNVFADVSHAGYSASESTAKIGSVRGESGNGIYRGEAMAQVIDLSGGSSTGDMRPSFNSAQSYEVSEASKGRSGTLGDSENNNGNHSSSVPTTDVSKGRTGSLGEKADDSTETSGPDTSTNGTDDGDETEVAKRPNEPVVDSENDISISGDASCEEATQNFLIEYPDIRIEISAIDQNYLEHASIQNVCYKDGKFSSCNFDFELYPNNLKTVCTDHGGNFYRTEHSIQCHNPSTMESLYYQFDHYPSCFSTACEDQNSKQLVERRINAITESMSDYLGMPCLADEDILKQATFEEIFKESSGYTRSSGQHWIRFVVPFISSFLLIYFI
mmetsp:Transcript_17014/g.38843  ORF Transcript_17014/g.38843 Transcript_17014/m.38843 type:complete len:355 (+) Transcript_17014:122-1186(+)